MESREGGQSRDTLPSGEVDQGITFLHLREQKHRVIPELAPEEVGSLHCLIFSTRTLLSFSQATELMWHALLQQTSVTATLFSLHPEQQSLEFSKRPHHDGDRAEDRELSCPGPNCCQDLALLQHTRY